eukprot:m.499719 g.499719  ORF g.499719 m.499719 type:complete len:188 (+) comp58496_c0_seq1:242-805(+)
MAAFVIARDAENFMANPQPLKSKSSAKKSSVGGQARSSKVFGSSSLSAPAGKRKALGELSTNTQHNRSSSKAKGPSKKASGGGLKVRSTTTPCAPAPKSRLDMPPIEEVHRDPYMPVIVDAELDELFQDLLKPAPAPFQRKKNPRLTPTEEVFEFFDEGLAWHDDSEPLSTRCMTEEEFNFDFGGED